MRVPFGIATPTQVNLLTRIEHGEASGARFYGTPRERWVHWNYLEARWELTDAGRAARELGMVAWRGLTRRGAIVIKWVEYNDAPESRRGWPQARAALERAGLWENGNLTERGQKVRKILRKYDVEVGY